MEKSTLNEKKLKRIQLPTIFNNFPKQQVNKKEYLSGKTDYYQINSIKFIPLSNSTTTLNIKLNDLQS